MIENEKSKNQIINYKNQINSLVKQHKRGKQQKKLVRDKNK
jgi:hypothetical protein